MKKYRPRKPSRVALMKSLDHTRKRLEILRHRCELDLGEVGAGVAIRDAQWAIETALDSLRARSSGWKARHRRGAGGGQRVGKT
jgi:hypothetical protein